MLQGQTTQLPFATTRQIYLGKVIYHHTMIQVRTWATALKECFYHAKPPVDQPRLSPNYVCSKSTSLLPLQCINMLNSLTPELDQVLTVPLPETEQT